MSNLTAEERNKILDSILIVHYSAKRFLLNQSDENRNLYSKEFELLTDHLSLLGDRLREDKFSSQIKLMLVVPFHIMEQINKGEIPDV